MNYLCEYSGLIMALYQGELANSKRSGFGIQLFLNESVYVGNWFEDKANGIGLLLLGCGISFQGMFQKNVIIDGIVTFPNGASYRGNFDGSNEQNFANGDFFFQNGCQLTGNWIQGRFQIGHLTIPGTPESGNRPKKISIDMRNNHQERDNGDHLIANEYFFLSGSQGINICNQKNTLFEGSISADYNVNGFGLRYYNTGKYLQMRYKASVPNGIGQEINIQKGIETEFKSENGKLVSRNSFYWINGVLAVFEPNLRVTIPILKKSKLLTTPSNCDENNLKSGRLKIENAILEYEDCNGEMKKITISVAKGPWTAPVLISLKLKFSWILKNILLENQRFESKINEFVFEHYELKSYELKDMMSQLLTGSRKGSANEKVNSNSSSQIPKHTQPSAKPSVDQYFEKQSFLIDKIFSGNEKVSSDRKLINDENSKIQQTIQIGAPGPLTAHPFEVSKISQIEQAESQISVPKTIDFKNVLTQLSNAKLNPENKDVSSPIIRQIDVKVTTNSQPIVSAAQIEKIKNTFAILTPTKAQDSLIEQSAPPTAKPDPEVIISANVVQQTSDQQVIAETPAKIVKPADDQITLREEQDKPKDPHPNTPVPAEYQIAQNSIVESENSVPEKLDFFDFLKISARIYFSGTLIEEKKSGHCEEKFLNGSTVKGNFQNDVFHGRCEIKNPDEEIFVGDFVDGKPFGIFTKITKTGETLKGQIFNNKFLQKKTVFIDNFAIEVLPDQVEKPCGPGVLTSADKRYALTCQFVEGVIPPNSRCTIQDLNHNINMDGTIYIGQTRECLVVTDTAESYSVKAQKKKIKNLMITLPICKPAGSDSYQN